MTAVMGLKTREVGCQALERPPDASARAECCLAAASEEAAKRALTRWPTTPVLRLSRYGCAVMNPAIMEKTVRSLAATPQSHTCQSRRGKAVLLGESLSALFRPHISAFVPLQASGAAPAAAENPFSDDPRGERK